MKIHVQAPATSANLGPGFDCLGLALDLWNELDVEVTGQGLKIVVEGEGKSEIAQNTSNAIYKAMLTYARRHEKTLPVGIKMTCLNRIPFGAGLGSSAAAAVSGILAASALLEIPQDKADQLECATRLEGHPDNVAPCLLGGLVASVMDGEKVIARSLAIAPLSLLVVTPDYQFPTKKSRAVLPLDVSRQDAIFNLSRLVFLTDALAKGDLDLLSMAMQDMLHQPHRIPLIPGATDAIAAARAEGAVPVVLSGAGPSLMAVLKNAAVEKQVAATMIEAFQRAGLAARSFALPIAQKGAGLQIR